MGDERKRTVAHSRLKQYLKEVDDHSKTPLTLHSANELLGRAEAKWKVLEEAQAVLEETATSQDALKVQFDAGTECERTYVELCSKLRKIIDQLSVSTTTTSSAASGAPGVTVKLPTISLPEFEGQFSEWVSFRDLFTAAVANNKSLSGAQKLQYLKTSLRGEPATLIKYLPTTDANYCEAWQILETRYNNTREIVQSQINRILDLKPVTSENAKYLQLLLDQCEECLHSLKVMKRPTDQWDDLIVVIVGTKLDSVTRREWAKRLTGNALPTYKELKDFLKSHICGLQAAGVSSSKDVGGRQGEKQVKVHHTTTESGSCAVCQGSHQIQECKEFLNSSPEERSALVRMARLCYNCLRPDHKIKDCTSPRKCKRCGSKHHTLLHEERKQQQQTQQGPSTSKEIVPTIQGNHVAADDGGLLMTAIANLPDQYGRMVPCRVFIDPGSEGDFMSIPCKKRLGLKSLPSRVRVKGVWNKKAGTCTEKVSCTLYSRYSNKELEVELLLMPEITGKLPRLPRDRHWKHLEGLEQADNKWYEPGDVDILLGVKVYDDVVLRGRRRGSKGAPVGHETIFGWGVAGVCPTVEKGYISSDHITLEQVGNRLTKFWKVEGPPKMRIPTKEEKFCESHFKAKYKIDSEGRFHVGVPFEKNKLHTLGKSKEKPMKTDGKLDCTQQSLLSELAAVSDLLGQISRVTLRGKLLMQEWWKLTMKWEDLVPKSIQERWGEYREVLPSSWMHVAETENPAGLASRGCKVEELKTCDIWWRDPSWLSRPELPAFPQEAVSEEDLEERQLVVAVLSIEKDDDKSIRKLSTLKRLKRCTAWYFRFFLFKIKKKVPTGPVTAAEQHKVMLFWLRKLQHVHYQEEFELLERRKPGGIHSKLKSLHPFTDNFENIRISGRLENARLPDEIVLPKEGHFAKLGIDYFHNLNFHSGFQQTWSSIQTEFWIVRGRGRVRHFVRSCIRCRRYRGKTAEQPMGALPAPRVTPSRPFTHTGVDYAGPFTLKDVVGKIPKLYKGYMCVFVCLATKAVCLEGVSALTTEAFVAAFRRFVARRGLPRRRLSFAEGSALNDAVADELSGRGITWHFNPPAAPHVGGLWKSAVKSAKQQRMVTGGGPMTFEQFVTLLAQVESVLNSRPLFAMSADPGDLQPLTPGHFLLGAPLLAAPDVDLEEIPRNRLLQFQRIQQQFQRFWRRWSIEYLNTLQQRTKWMWEQDNVKVGDLVLLVEESAPANWKVGRILEVHPEKEGNVRKVTVKTATSTFERVITKPIPLLRRDIDY